MTEPENNAKIAKNDESVPADIHTYVESLYGPDPDLERVRQSLREHGIWDVSIERGCGLLLTLLVRTSGARRILEIGALGGYSGICLARGLPPDGRLVSLELERKHADLAYANLQAAGLGEKAEYRVGPALSGLEQLAREGAKFDLVFIDADKANYVHYLDWALQLTNPGAIIAGDNAFMRGRTLNPAVTSNSVQRMREFNRRMVSDPRLEGLVLPAFDGLCLARVKSANQADGQGV